MNEHPLYYVILASSFVLLTGSALLALRWALRTGQLRDSKKTALVIFDDDEPVGQMTDSFPDKGSPRALVAKTAESQTTP
jgi:nitrogen fixation-related uncharacterized protein